MTGMASDPADAARRYLDTFVCPDLGAMRASLEDEVRWLDERTAAWRRGADALVEYNRAGLEGTTGFWIDLRDVETLDAGDAAVVSGTLVMGGTYDGQPYEVVCPTTLLLRRAGDAWRVAYEHALEHRPRVAEPAGEGDPVAEGGPAS